MNRFNKAQLILKKIVETLLKFKFHTLQKKISLTFHDIFINTHPYPYLYAHNSLYQRRNILNVVLFFIFAWLLFVGLSITDNSPFSNN